jgi:short-subunit dehydrogenase
LHASTILITGASSGIGAALARSLAGPDRMLILMGRNRPRLDAVAACCRSKGASCRIACIDLRDRDELAAFIDQLDRSQGVDLLFSNAGVMLGRRKGQVTESADAAARVLRTNLLASIDLVNLVLPGMRRRGRGAIVLTSSLAALVPLSDAPAYSASKAALVAYGLALREALAPEGIKVVVACPGYVTTPMIAGHHGIRPGEMSADEAARRILRSLERNAGLNGFPAGLFWLARVSLLVPESLRRLATRFFRFHLETELK